MGMWTWNTMSVTQKTKWPQPHLHIVFKTRIAYHHLKWPKLVLNDPLWWYTTWPPFAILKISTCLNSLHVNTHPTLVLGKCESFARKCQTWCLMNVVWHRPSVPNQTQLVQFQPSMGILNWFLECWWKKGQSRYNFGHKKFDNLHTE